MSREGAFRGNLIGEMDTMDSSRQRNARKGAEKGNEDGIRQCCGSGSAWIQNFCLDPEL